MRADDEFGDDGDGVRVSVVSLSGAREDRERRKLKDDRREVPEVVLVRFARGCGCELLSACCCLSRGRKREIA